MDQGSSSLPFWPTPEGRHVHDDPFNPRKLPYPFRLTGGVLLKIWPPVLSIGILATIIVIVNVFTHYHLYISSTLTSVIGFIVGLSVTFRNQTAYERYTEGRKLWNQLQVVIRNMARVIWLQASFPFHFSDP
jgi:ion channel-forming bestrophin family protein